MLITFAPSIAASLVRGCGFTRQHAALDATRSAPHRALTHGEGGYRRQYRRAHTRSCHQRRRGRLQQVRLRRGKDRRARAAGDLGGDDLKPARPNQRGTPRGAPLTAPESPASSRAGGFRARGLWECRGVQP
jgi:hypothetical protein